MFTACRIVEVDTMAGFPGGPRVECLCRPGILIQVGHYAQHVANAVSKDLIERCVKAEHTLKGQVGPCEGNSHEESKASGVALVRSYIEEVPRG